jgi:hypothetical protein
MKKIMIVFAAGAAILMTGCSVTKVNYKKDADGVCEYRIYHNDHWLKRETGAMSGGMTTDGKFEVKLENATVSPSEEFNKSMQTYTTAFVQLAQIAAAAYNPSASAAVQSTTEKQGAGTATVAQPEAAAAPNETAQQATTTNAVECVDCKDGDTK